MDTANQYDVIIIGTGTAGSTAAGILTDAGKSVAIIDKRPYGGTCALRGCQPKKYLVVHTHLAAETEALVGSSFSQPAKVQWEALQRFRHSFTDAVPEGTRQSLASQGIDTFSGTARLLTSRSVIIDEQEVLTADQILIATGSHPRELVLPDSIIPAVSDDFLGLEQLPDSLIFIGGGYISLEFAFIAGLMGKQVTILQKGDTILPQFPASLTDPMRIAGAEHHITMITGVDVTAITQEGGSYVVKTSEHGEFGAQFVMAAIGRVPDTADLGLEAIGVRQSARGIITDAWMQSSVNGIYAAGDCVASLQLSPVSDMEAQAAAANILRAQSRAVQYDRIPSVVFTYPQMAHVGMSAEAAQHAGRAVRIQRGDGSGWPNYRRLDEHLMQYEVIIDPESDLILGAQLIGPHAGELINLFALAIRQEIPSAVLKDLPWAYPTYSADCKYML
jgi:glutathione reductase (NADPH)